MIRAIALAGLFFSSACRDSPRFALTHTYKLAVIDTGVAMTGEEMVHYMFPVCATSSSPWFGNGSSNS